LGAYLAHRDAWFRRFVFNVEGGKMLYPYLETSELNKELFPFSMFRRNIELYLREASHVMPFRLYRCWLKMY
jgi:hypothetical protein